MFGIGTLGIVPVPGVLVGSIEGSSYGLGGIGTLGISPVPGVEIVSISPGRASDGRARPVCREKPEGVKPGMPSVCAVLVKDDDGRAMPSALAVLSTAPNAREPAPAPIAAPETSCVLPPPANDIAPLGMPTVDELLGAGEYSGEFAMLGCPPKVPRTTLPIAPAKPPCELEAEPPGPI